MAVRPYRTLLLRCGLAALSFVAMDMAAATAVRFASGRPWWQTKAEQVEKSYRIRSPYYHHDLLPGVNLATAIWGTVEYPLATDSMGFKDRSPRVITLKASGRRLLLIGDSFTEGIGMPYAKSYAGLIADQLGREGVDVLNAGVSSYAPIIYWKKVEHLIERVGFTFDELVVFMDLSDPYDEAMTYSLDASGAVVSSDDAQALSIRYRAVMMLKNHTIVTYSLCNALADHLLAARRRHRELGAYDTYQVRGLWTQDATLYDTYARTGLARMQEHMDSLHQLLSRHGIRLIVAVYPWPYQVRAQEGDSVHVRQWSSWCSVQGVDFVNLFPAFIDGKADAPSAERVITACYIPGDVHFSEQGHRVVASEFLRQYDELSHGPPGVGEEDLRQKP